MSVLCSVLSSDRRRKHAVPFSIRSPLTDLSHLYLRQEAPPLAGNWSAPPPPMAAATG